MCPRRSVKYALINKYCVFVIARPLFCPEITLHSKDMLMRSLQRLAYFTLQQHYSIKLHAMCFVTVVMFCSPSGPRRFALPPIPAMLPCLRRVLRPALSLRAGTGLATAGLSNHQTPATIASTARFASEPPLPVLLQRCNLGTHPLKEPVEPLDSPRGAKEFIYTLHPSERTCLLRELHRFESIAIAQGRWCATVGTAYCIKCVLY